MSIEDIENEINKITNTFNCKIESINNLVYIIIVDTELHNILLYLKQSSFETLIDCFAMNMRDNNENNVIYYHLLSYKYNVCVCVYTNIYNKAAQSIINIFENANWYEREIYEMYNINFIGHKNLKKLFTD